MSVQVQEIQFRDPAARILEQKPVPKPVPTEPQMPMKPAPDEAEDIHGEKMVLNMGPSHPATHGVLRLVLELDGEIITKADPESGFVQSVSVRDGDRSIVLSPDSFRRAIGLRLGWNTVLSPTFTVERRGSRFIFRGRGFGSQVGLCEEGAIAQASAGRGYREILSFYYPGAEIVDRTSNE